MIQVNKVAKFYGKNIALKDISFSIEAEDIYGIVGHSGAGKSTLLRCLNGLEGYSDGSISVFNKEVKALKNKELRLFRKDLGMIFQNFNLMTRLTVSENIAMPLKAWGEEKNNIKKKVDELLNIVGLNHKRDSYPSNLSGGEKQRVGIARALALNPKVLLCDEATSALDPKTTQSILDLIVDINKKLGITIVIVTHQMEVVKSVCNKMMLLEDGEIKAIGLTEELFLNPPNEMENLLGESEILPLSGVNIRLVFPKNNSYASIITSMARELDIDFSICWGKLERFREDVLGALIINIEEKDKDNVVEYLNHKGIYWEIKKGSEVIENAESMDSKINK